MFTDDSLLYAVLQVRPTLVPRSADTGPNSYLEQMSQYCIEKIHFDIPGPNMRRK